MIHYRVSVLTGSSGKLKIKSDLQKDTPLPVTLQKHVSIFLISLNHSLSRVDLIRFLSLTNKHDYKYLQPIPEEEV